MELPLDWRCSSPKKLSGIRMVTHCNMMSFSTKLPTMESLCKLKLMLPTTLSHPKHQSLPSLPSTSPLSPPNAPVTKLFISEILSPRGTHLLASTYPLSTHRPVLVIQHLGATPPHPPISPTTHLHSINTWPAPRPPHHLSCAGLVGAHKHLDLSALSRTSRTREDTFIHLHHHLTSPSLLHHRRGSSTAQSAPGPCLLSLDRLLEVSYTQTPIIMFHQLPSIYSLYSIYFYTYIHAYFQPPDICTQKTAPHLVTQGTREMDLEQLKHNIYSQEDAPNADIRHCTTDM